MLNFEFFPFNRPFYKDLLFYAFLYFVYVRFEKNLGDVIEYDYGNSVIQVGAALLDSMLVPWIFAILLAWFRQTFYEKVEQHKKKR